MRQLLAGYSDFSNDHSYPENLAVPDGQHPVVKRFCACLISHPELRMLIARAAKQADQPAFQNADEMAAYFGALLSLPPAYSSEGSFVGCPVNALFKPIMTVPVGRELFRHPVMNDFLRFLTKSYCTYLDSEHSAGFLTEEAPHGWFCKTAASKLGLDQFVHDKTKPHYNFSSWNAFFLRKFKAGQRPVEQPTNSRVVSRPCESKIFRIERDLAPATDFWVKSLPYSLRDIFGADQATARRFQGGSLVQAMLESQYYHRWHVPVDGVVSSIRSIRGSLYAAVDHAGEKGLKQSLSFLSHVANRFYIEIKRSTGDRVGCLFIGMAEVSSGVVAVRVGQTVRRGEEMGYFQYGGSSYCLFFEKDAVAEFTVEPNPDLESADPVLLNKTIALLRR